MIRLACLLLVTSFLASPALAQAFRVQTGQHSDFTRVVVSLPSEQALWEFRPDADGYALFLAPQSRGTLDGFYDLIPRDLVTGVYYDFDAGKLSFMCNCSAQAQLYQSRHVVIDFRSTPSPSAFPVIFETAETPKRPEILHPIPAAWQPPMRRNKSNGDEAIAASASALSTAVAQGTLQAIGPQSLSGGHLQATAPTASAPGIAFRTAMEQVPVASAEVEKKDARCIDDPLLSFPTFSAEDEFGETFVMLRSQIIDDIGNPVPDAILVLAKFQAANGLGVEARRLLHDSQLDTLASTSARALTFLSESDFVRADLGESGKGCAGWHGFWASLSDTSSLSLQLPTDEIVHKFKTLPPYLQEKLVHRTVERLRSVGHADEALLVLQTVVGDRDKFVAHASQGVSEAFQGGMIDAMGAARSPTAMQDHFEVATEASGPLDDNLIGAVASLAFEFQGTEDAAKLTDTVLSSLTARGDIHAATAFVISLSKNGQPEDFERNLDTFFAYAVEEASDAELVDLLFGELGAKMPPDFALQAQSRLEAIGIRPPWDAPEASPVAVSVQHEPATHIEPDIPYSAPASETVQSAAPTNLANYRSLLSKTASVEQNVQGVLSQSADFASLVEN